MSERDMECDLIYLSVTLTDLDIEELSGGNGLVVEFDRDDTTIAVAIDRAVVAGGVRSDE